MVVDEEEEEHQARFLWRRMESWLNGVLTFSSLSLAAADDDDDHADNDDEDDDGSDDGGDDDDVVVSQFFYDASDTFVIQGKGRGRAKG